MNKKLLALAVCCMTTLSMFTACGKEIDTTSGDSANNSQSETATESGSNKITEVKNYTAPEKGDKIVEINFKDYGTVKIRLFPEYAEKACENFTKLIESGYYNGLTFHRIIQDFMIQGGDPLGNGTGGESAWGGEFDGGVSNSLAHVPGALCYANSGSTATNGSQFYIVTGEREITDETFALYESYGLTFTDVQKETYKKTGGVPSLDGGYTVFGQVIDGLDIIFQLSYVATDANDKPLADVVMESVKLSEYNGEEIKWYLSDYTSQDPLDAVPLNYTAPEAGDEIISIKFKDYGTVKFRLFPEVAPQGVENFVEHAKSGYYDGLTFHRIISDFMIQGGESIWGDKFDGGKYYNLIHAAGAVAYANSGSTATNGSQFYIVTGNVYDESGFADLESKGNTFRDSVKEIYQTQGGTPFLDGAYTVFGQVIDGLDVVFEIQNVETNTDNKPLTDVIMESVTVEEYDGSEIKWYISDYSEDDEEAEETTEDTGSTENTENTESTENTEESEEATEAETTAE